MPDAGPSKNPGFVAWIEGLPGAGKTTLSKRLSERLLTSGLEVEVLDGDEVRRMFSPELGFSRKDREFHARRVSYVAQMLARHGVAVIVAMITPYETSRQAARATFGGRFAEVWLRCPLEICQKRDPKGVYRTGDGGAHKITGVDDPFEEPLNPELVVDTGTKSIDESADAIVAFLTKAGYVPGLR